MHEICNNTMVTCSWSASSLLSQFLDLLAENTMIKETQFEASVVQVGKFTVGRSEQVNIPFCASKKKPQKKNSVSKAFIPFCCSCCRLLSGISGRLGLQLCCGLEWIRTAKWCYEYHRAHSKATLQNRKGLTHLEVPTQTTEMLRLPDANLDVMASIIPDSCT